MLNNPSDKCPECGSSSVEVHKYQPRDPHFFGLPYGTIQYQCVCFSCGLQWTADYFKDKPLPDTLHKPNSVFGSWYTYLGKHVKKEAAQ